MSAAEQLQLQEELQEPLTVTLRLVPANPDHFAEDGKFKNGVLYFLKSEVTGQMENRPYYTGEHTDIFEFRRWFRLKMVYEAISPADAVLFGYDIDLNTSTTSNPATYGTTD